jgi:SET domain-containing protein
VEALSNPTRPNLEPNGLAYQSAVSAGIRIDKSEGKGFGAFATIPIVQGEWIGDYEGEMLTTQEVKARYWNLGKPKKDDRRWKKSRKRRGQGMSGDYLFDLSDDIYVDGEDTDASGWCRFMNHAEETKQECNVKTESSRKYSNGENVILPRLWFTAKRDIEAGEELLYDYGDGYWEEKDDV